MRDGLQGRSYLEDFDCFGTVLLVEVGGGGGGRVRELRMTDGLMADGLVDAENRKDSGMTTRILDAGSTGVRTLPMVSNKVLPEILIPSWLLAASETRRHRLDFLSTASFGAFE